MEEQIKGFPELGIRENNCLTRNNIYCWEDLHNFCKGDEANLYKVRALGRKSVTNICNACQRAGGDAIACKSHALPVVLSLKYHYKSSAHVLVHLAHSLLMYKRDQYTANVDIECLRVYYHTVFDTLPTMGMSSEYLIQILEQAAILALKDNTVLADPKRLLASCELELSREDISDDGTSWSNT